MLTVADASDNDPKISSELAKSFLPGVPLGDQPYFRELRHRHAARYAELKQLHGDALTARDYDLASDVWRALVDMGIEEEITRQYKLSQIMAERRWRKECIARASRIHNAMSEPLNYTGNRLSGFFRYPDDAEWLQQWNAGEITWNEGVA